MLGYGTVQNSFPDGISQYDLSSTNNVSPFKASEFQRVAAIVNYSNSTVQKDAIIYGSYFTDLSRYANLYSFRSNACNLCNEGCQINDVCAACNTNNIDINFPKIYNCTQCNACQTCNENCNSNCNKCQGCNGCELCNTGCQSCDAGCEDSCDVACEYCNSEVPNCCDIGNTTITCILCDKCEGCNSGNIIDTGGCIECDSCEGCDSGNIVDVCTMCDSDEGGCDGCQGACEVDCQTCNNCETCDEGCEECVEGCQVTCDTCEGCNVCQACDHCQTCDSCEECVNCEGCNTRCELVDEACELFNRLCKEEQVNPSACINKNKDTI